MCDLPSLDGRCVTVCGMIMFEMWKLCDLKDFLTLFWQEQLGSDL